MPKDPKTLVLLGVTYAGERKWADAEKYMQSALALDPRSRLALSELTDLRLLLNEPEKAVAQLQQHIASYPDDAQAHLLLGTVYRKQKDFKHAEASLARAVELAPQQQRARLMLGDVMYGQGLIDAAIAQIEEALKQQPRSANLHLLLGQARLRKGEASAARKHFEDALTINPNSAVAANNVAYVQANYGGDLDAALALAQKARELAPNMIDAADTLGWIQYKKGWYERSILLFEECVKRNPQSPIYRYHLGMALFAAGQKEKSRPYLEASVRSGLDAGDLTQARDTLAKIR
jgi:tetratricopeptide (TPR) repeat protein